VGKGDCHLLHDQFGAREEQDFQRKGAGRKGVSTVEVVEKPTENNQIGFKGSAIPLTGPISLRSWKNIMIGTFFLPCFSYIKKDIIQPVVLRAVRSRGFLVCADLHDDAFLLRCNWGQGLLVAKGA
jgi:hypothetical protein